MLHLIELINNELPLYTMYEMRGNVTFALLELSVKKNVYLVVICFKKYCAALLSKNRKRKKVWQQWNQNNSTVGCQGTSA